MGNNTDITNRIALSENTTTTPGQYFYGIGMANPVSGIYGLGLYGGTNTSLPTNTNMHMFIQNNGNVGIGTYSPGDKLTVNGNVTASSGVLSVNTSGLDGSTYQRFIICAYSANGNCFDLAKDANNNKLPLLFKWRGDAYNQPAMCLMGNGYVGIGTSTPAQTLDVNGNIRTSGTILAATNIGIGTSTPLNNLHINKFVDLNTTTTSTIRLQSFSPYMASHYTHFLIVGQYDNAKYSKLSFYGANTSVSTTDPINLNNPIMELYENGVDIDRVLTVAGISSSAAITSLTGNYYSGSSNLTLAAGGTARVTILSSNGNVGIGTTSPQSQLHIYGSGELLRLQSSTTNGWNYLTFADSNNDDMCDVGYSSAIDENTFFISNTSRMCFTNTNASITLNTDGNVGINVHVPKNTLDINGGIVIGHTYAGYITAPTDGLLVKGNVGIGTTNPTEMLTVNGKILSEGVRIVGDVPGSDFVFEKNYKLMKLSDVEKFVNENKRLPELPSAKEFKENGYSVGTMDDVLLRKVEELTLYLIEQEKLLKFQAEKIKTLEDAIKEKK